MAGRQVVGDVVHRQRRATVGPKRRSRGVESEQLCIWVDADVKAFADEAAAAEHVTVALWVQELIRRDREESRGADVA